MYASTAVNNDSAGICERSILKLHPSDRRVTDDYRRVTAIFKVWNKKCGDAEMRECYNFINLWHALKRMPWTSFVVSGYIPN
jgi:hypothetical protein